MELQLLAVLLSFIACLFVLPVWISKARKLGLLWEDMNKYKTPKNVVAAGGVNNRWATAAGAPLRMLDAGANDNVADLFVWWQV